MAALLWGLQQRDTQFHIAKKYYQYIYIYNKKLQLAKLYIYTKPIMLSQVDPTQIPFITVITATLQTTG